MYAYDSCGRAGVSVGTCTYELRPRSSRRMHVSLLTDGHIVYIFIYIKGKKKKLNFQQKGNFFLINFKVVRHMREVGRPEGVGISNETAIFRAGRIGRPP